MTDIIDNNKLIDLVIEKHNKFIAAFKDEFSGLENKLNEIRKQADDLKKEIETAESKINVLNEKHFLFFHQAKKLRDELFYTVLEKMQQARAPNTHDVMRLSGRIDEYEKKLQNSRNIDDEEKTITEVKKLLHDFESEARKAAISVTLKAITDKLDEAHSSHKELLSVQDKPKQDTDSAREFDKQKDEIEGRHNWLKRRIESHMNALAYWEKQKGGIKVE